MGFLDRIFGYRKQVKMIGKSPADSEQAVPKNENAIKLLGLKDYIDTLMDADRYIAKSDYLENIKEYKSVIDFFDVLKSSGMLDGSGQNAESKYF